MNMPDLAERLREFVEAAQPAVTMDEVKETVNRHHLGDRLTPMPAYFVLVPVLVLVLVLAIAVPILVIGGGSNNAAKIAGTGTQPRWALAVDSEQPWQVRGSANPGSYSLVCPTQSDCYATSPSSITNTEPSGVVEVSKDGGNSWHSSLVASAGSDLSGLTCPSAQTCMVTGQDLASDNLGVTMFTTNDGGATWTHQAIAGGSLGSSLLSCSSATQCVATTSEPGPGGLGEQDVAIVTSDGGVHWVTVPFPGTFRPYALGCTPGGACVAVGQSPSNYIIVGGASIHGSGTALFSDDGGLTWQKGQIPTADTLTSLSCADPLHCMAVESTQTLAGSPDLAAGPLTDTFISTRDGGKTWTRTPGNEPEQWSLGAISCATALHCWATGALHAPGATLRSVSDWQGLVLATDDGGQTWHSVELPQFDGVPITTVASLSCPDSTTCFGLAYDPTSPPGQGQHQLVLVSRVQSS
jgi:photosystem II stability/assembly factor-like uncharacterized protein